MEVIVIEAEAYKQIMNRFSAMEEFMQKLTDQLTENAKSYLNISEVMELTALSRSSIDKYKGDIGYTIIGGCYRFKRTDVQEYIERNYFKNKISKAS